MRVAVAYENGKVFQHFGHAEQFKIYDVINDEIIATEVVDVEGSGHSALSEWLRVQSVKKLVCGGIGTGAIRALTEDGITVYGGVKGDADTRVEQLFNGTLKFSTKPTCSHHDDDKAHECGNHDHKCGGC
ncbi:MAG: NifB/NifX family molybdenum-iron cluster-binding protein [Oscillospiraceae bacterium]